MRIDNLRCFGEKRNQLHHFVSTDRVLVQTGYPFLCQRARLAKNRSVGSYLADVMQKRATRNHSDLIP